MRQLRRDFYKRLLKLNENPLTVSKHFTTTVYIFHKQKILLHLHRKLGKWLPPGGHLEPNETPPEAARREVLEETGLEIVFIQQEHLKIDADHAVSFESPFLCLLEQVPAYQETPAHQHMDFIYLARPKEIREPLNGFRWFNDKELQGLDLFSDTSEICRYLFTNGDALFLAQAEMAAEECPNDRGSPLVSDSSDHHISNCLDNSSDHNKRKLQRQQPTQ